MGLCFCGCGTELREGLRFATGHQCRMPKTREKIRQITSNQSEETKRLRRESLRKVIHTKEWNEKVSKSSKGQKHSKEQNEKHSIYMTELWKNKEYKNNMIEKHVGYVWSEETIRKRNQSRLIWWESEKGLLWRKNHSGEKNYNWKGGISDTPYGKDFTNKLKRAIKKRDNYKCKICGNPNSLHVHHIDYNKQNNKQINLITLCKSCHMKTNGNRGYWKNYFKGGLR
jgi:hypothetical protein